MELFSAEGHFTRNAPGDLMLDQDAIVLRDGETEPLTEGDVLDAGDIVVFDDAWVVQVLPGGEHVVLGHDLPMGVLRGMAKTQAFTPQQPAAVQDRALAATPLEPVEQKLVDALPGSPQVGELTIPILVMHQTLQRQLDLHERDIERFMAAAQLALEQVQDKRIEWLEQGPEIEWGELLIWAVIGAVIGEGASVAIKKLIFRALTRMRALRHWAADLNLAPARGRAAEERTSLALLTDLKNDLIRKEKEVTDRALAEFWRTGRIAALPVPDDVGRAQVEQARLQIGEALKRVRKAEATETAAEQAVERLQRLRKEGGALDEFFLDLPAEAGKELLLELKPLVASKAAAAGRPQSRSPVNALRFELSVLKSRLLEGVQNIRRTAEFILHILSIGRGTSAAFEISAAGAMRNLLNSIELRNPLTVDEARVSVFETASMFERVVWSLLVRVELRSFPQAAPMLVPHQPVHIAEVESLRSVSTGTPLEEKVISYLHTVFGTGDLRSLGAALERNRSHFEAAARALRDEGDSDIGTLMQAMQFKGEQAQPSSAPVQPQTPAP
jgi:hypothetical protein